MGKKRPGIKVVSFDLEGTVVTPDFSQSVWHEGIPSLYARKKGIDFEEARVLVEAAYDQVGERRKEWYDISYWFDLFQLGEYHRVLETYRHRALPYPETIQVLSNLGRAYTLIISSSSAREFLPYLLDGIDRYFARVFSSISDYGQLKNPEFYLTVCREMGVEPGQMVHVGDSWQFDFLAAKEIGIEVFHIDREQEHQHGTSLSSLTDLSAELLGD